MTKKKKSKPRRKESLALSEELRLREEKIERAIQDHRVPLGDATDEQLLAEVNRRRHRCTMAKERR
jgi:hypothetical protein